jgi:hypothetical protein
MGIGIGGSDGCKQGVYQRLAVSVARESLQTG